MRLHRARRGQPHAHEQKDVCFRHFNGYIFGFMPRLISTGVLFFCDFASLSDEPVCCAYPRPLRLWGPRVATATAPRISTKQPTK